MLSVADISPASLRFQSSICLPTLCLCVGMPRFISDSACSLIGDGAHLSDCCNFEHPTQLMTASAAIRAVSRHAHDPLIRSLFHQNPKVGEVPGIVSLS